MYLRPIRLLVPPRIVAEFKRQAKLAFPKETFAFLLGRDAGTIVEVEELFVPLDVEHCCTEDGVIGTETWYTDAQAEAAANELHIVGDIHSHPYRHGCGACGHEPSEGDLDAGMTQIHGICLINERRNGSLVASIRFWGPMIPVVTGTP